MKLITLTLSAALFGSYFNSLELFIGITLAFIYLGLLVDSINLTLEAKNDRIKP